MVYIVYIYIYSIYSIYYIPYRDIYIYIYIYIYISGSQPMGRGVFCLAKYVNLKKSVHVLFTIEYKSFI